MRISWMDQKLGYEWHPLEQETAVSYPQSAVGSQQPAKKIIRDGQLLIVREGREYSVMGIEN